MRVDGIGQFRLGEERAHFVTLVCGEPDHVAAAQQTAELQLPR